MPSRSGTVAAGKRVRGATPPPGGGPTSYDATVNPTIDTTSYITNPTIGFQEILAQSVPITCAFTGTGAVGNADTGQVPTVVQGTWARNADKLQRAGTPADSDLIVWDSGFTNHTIKMTLTAINQQAIAARVVDINNYYMVYPDTTATKLMKRVAGTYTQLGADGPVLAEGNTLELDCQGSTITGRINGTTFTSVTDTSLTTGTKAGARAGGSGTGTTPRWDNLEILFSGTNTVHTPVETTPYRRATGEFFWKDINTANNTYNWTRIDQFLLNCAAAGQKGSFRVVSMRGESFGNHQVPAWVIALDAGVLGGPGSRIDGTPTAYRSIEPNYESQTYQENWRKFIDALRVRYDGDPRIAFIDVSGYGDFNEYSYLANHDFESDPFSLTVRSQQKAREYLTKLFVGGASSTHSWRTTASNSVTVATGVSYNHPGFEKTQLLMPVSGGIRHHSAWALHITSQPKTLKFGHARDQPRPAVARWAELGKTPDLVTIFYQWGAGLGGGSDWSRATHMETEVNAIFAAAPNAVAVLSWEPMDGNNWTNYTHDYILGNTTYDAYIDSWANKIIEKRTAWGLAAKPIVIRFAHEQNTNWYAWGMSNTGNTAAKYIQVWQKVWNRFNARFNANSLTMSTFVKWEWSPVSDPGLDGNTTNRTSLTANGEHRNFAETYPGHTYVDQVSFSFYNHGTEPYNSTQYPPSGWTPPWLPVAYMEWDAYRLKAISNNKPLRIAEVGVHEVGGDKAQWVRDLYAYAPLWDILSATWFDNDWSMYNQRDWRIKEPDAASFAAWQAETHRPARPVGVRDDGIGGPLSGSGSPAIANTQSLTQSAGKFNRASLREYLLAQWPLAPAWAEWAGNVHVPPGSGGPWYGTASWVQNTIDLGRIVHMSGVHDNMDMAPLPGVDQYQTALKFMGYRLAVKRVLHPTILTRGSTATFELDVANYGYAPPYKAMSADFKVRLALRNASGVVVHTWEPAGQVSGLWLPNADVTLTPPSYSYTLSAVSVPAGISAGTYTLCVGMVNVAPSNSVGVADSMVNLAQAGRHAATGYYDIASVTVV